jgi:acyl-CoA synthetase (AMP-forming)/AMP-acid ligase II
MYFFDQNPDYANRPLCIDADNSVTIRYNQWYETAAALKQILRPRTLAFILCSNTSGSLLAYLCCLQNRIVPLLLDENMDEALLRRLLTLYKPAYIFQKTKKAGPSGTALSELYNYTVYRTDETSSVPLYGELALLLTTSGSTGSPKLVRQSYQNIQANASAIAQYLEITCDDRPITALPMHYTFGLSVINSHVLAGAAVYLTESTLFEESFWQLCRSHHITSMAGVPFTYECLRRLRFCKMHLPDLTLLIQAGGKLSKTLQQEFALYAERCHKRFIVMYGQTEATARMSYLPPSHSLSKIGSIGIAIPGGTFHIMEDAATEITQSGRAGELCYDGPNVTLGYAQTAADLAKGDEWHGRLWTGDIACRDDDGYYYIVGRKKRFIKIVGKRVNLDEIEQLFRNDYSAYGFACTGADDALHIYTTAPEDMQNDLTEYFIKKTSLPAAAFTISHIAALPVNSSGKIQYSQLK